MEKFKAFETWLIEKQDISRGTRIGYMEIVDKALKVKDFEKIKSVSILQRLVTEFKTNRTFLAKSRVEKTGILASLTLYVAFLESQKQGQDKLEPAT